MAGVNSVNFSAYGKSGLSPLAGGQDMADSARLSAETNKFDDLVRSIQAKSASDTRLNGDIATGFAGTFTAESDKSARAQGMAASSDKTIDRTSELYEKSLELESYFVKMMLTSMRGTLGESSLTGRKSHAQSMYEDMLYDEYATAMTKSAGFGLADQVYLSLVQRE